MSKRFYWFKLKNSFFKRHDIKYIESLPDGKEYVLIYLKLMVESLDHDGELRFSETIPYDEQMISALVNSEVNIVTSALDTMEKLGMIVKKEDGTLSFPLVEGLIGSASDTDEARRIRRFRERQKDTSVTNSNANVTESVTKCNGERYTSVTNDNESIEYRDKSIEYRDIDKEKSIKEKTTRFLPPTLDEISSYCLERNNGIDPQRFFDFYQSKGWMVGKNKMKDWKAAVRNWETRSGTKSAPPSSSNPFTSSNNPFTELRRQEGYT